MRRAAAVHVFSGKKSSVHWVKNSLNTCFVY